MPFSGFVVFWRAVAVVPANAVPLGSKLDELVPEAVPKSASTGIPFSSLKMSKQRIMKRNAQMNVAPSTWLAWHDDNTIEIVLH